MLQRHLVPMQGVDETSLQQVQDLHGAVAGATDQVFVGRMEGKAVDRCTMDWSRNETNRRRDS